MLKRAMPASRRALTATATGYRLHQRNIHPVFRIPQSSVTAFREGDQDNVHLNLMPPKDALRNM